MTQDLSLTDGDVGTLIRNLSSRQPAVRQEAELALKGLPPDQVNQLVQILRSEPKKAMGRMGLWWAVVSWPMIFLPSWLTFGQGGGMSPAWRCILFGSFLAAYTVLFPLLVAKPRYQGSLMYCVMQVNEAKLLGPLITYTRFASETAGGASRFRSKVTGSRMVTPADIDRSLLAVLRKVKTGEDLDLIGAERIGLTKRLLSRNSEVVIEILRLLDTAGGSRDLANVKILERGGHSGRDSQAVLDAAAQCRMIIEARLNEQQIPETLLRASQSSSPTRELVRPTIAAAPDEEKLLLRTSQVEETLTG